MQRRVLPMSDPHFDLRALPPTLPDGRSRNLLLASFLSTLLSGAGHFLVNRRRKGALLLAFFCVLLLLWWPARLLQYFWGIAPLAIGMIPLFIFAAWDVPYGGKHRTDKPSQWWLTVLLPLALLATAAHGNWATRVSGFQSFAIASQSMENTVVVGNSVMVDRWNYSKKAPERRDIVVFTRQGIYLVKRVIALGGETIEGRQGEILIDGKPLQEPYVIHTSHRPPEMNNFGPMRIPLGQLFVMGDNRDISLDSRVSEFGLVDVNAVCGRALYTLPSLHDNSHKMIK